MGVKTPPTQGGAGRGEPGSGSSAHLVLTSCCLCCWRAARVHASDMKASLYITSGEGLWLPAWTLMTGISHCCLTVAQRDCGISQPPPVYHETVLVPPDSVAPNAAPIPSNCILYPLLYFKVWAAPIHRHTLIQNLELGSTRSIRCCAVQEELVPS